MSAHEYFLQTVMQGREANFFVGSGYANFSVETIDGVQSLVARTVLGETIGPVALGDQKGVFNMFAELESQRLRVGFKDGMIYGQSGNVFQNLPGVQSVTRGLLNFRRKGIQRNQQLHNLSMQGYQIREAIIDPSVERGFDTIEKLVFGSNQSPGRVSADDLADHIKGALVPTGSGGIRIIQITKKGAEGPMSFRETMDLLGLDPFSVRVGLGDGAVRNQNVTDLLGKLGKRLRGHFQSKGISIQTGENTRLKAAVFDPRSLFGDEYQTVLSEVMADFRSSRIGPWIPDELRKAAEEAIKQMFDGQVINVNPRNLQRLALENNRQYIRDIGRRLLPEQDYRAARQAAGRQLRLLRTGGVGNVRIENAEIVDLSGELLLPDSPLTGRQIKGNMNFVALSDSEIESIMNDRTASVHERVMARAIHMARQNDIDFLAPETGVVPELGAGFSRRHGTLVHIAAQKEADTARLNRQTLRAQPEFYGGTEEIINYARNNVEIALDELSRGNISDDVLQYLRSQANMYVEDAYDYSTLDRAQVSARQRAIDEADAIVKFVDSGQSLLKDPAMRSRIERAIKHRYYGTEANNPKYIIPNAMAGHISADAVVLGQSRDYVNTRHGRLAEGFLAYDPQTNQFVFPTVNVERFRRYLQILGGADLDDTINASLFYDANPGPQSSRIVAAIFRNPTARGEGLLLNMRQDDALVARKLRELSTFYANTRGNLGDEEARDYFHNDYERDMNRKRSLQENLRTQERSEYPQPERMDELRRQIEEIDSRFDTHAQNILRSADEAVEVATQDASERIIRHRTQEALTSYGRADIPTPEGVQTFRSLKDGLRGVLGIADAADGRSTLHLGQAINFSDFMETLLDGEVYRVLRQHGFDPANIQMYGREDLIDYYQKFGGRGSQVEATLNAAMEAVAESLRRAVNDRAIGGDAVRLPFTSLFNLDKTYALPERFIDVANEILKDSGTTLQELVGTLDQDNTLLGEYMKAARGDMMETDIQIEQMEAAFKSQNLNAYVSEVNTEDYRKAAESVIKEYEDQRKAFKIDGENIIEGTELDVQKRIANDRVLQRAMQEAQSLSENLGVSSVDALDEILMNVRSLADQGGLLSGMLNDLASNRSGKFGISNMLRNVASRRFLLDQQVNVLDLLMMEGGEEVNIADSARLTREEVDELLGELNRVRLTEADIRRGVPGLDRLRARSVVDNVVARIPSPKDITEGVKALWHRDVFRKGFYGIAAVAAASAIYQNSKDVSPEAMQGPEFLPGGSAYEDYMQPSVDYPTFNGFRSQSSTTYSIQTNGQYDPAMVAAAAEQITGVSAQGMISYRQPVFADTDRAISNGF